MRLVIAATLLLAACGRNEPAAAPPTDVSIRESVAGGWELRSAEGGAGLALLRGPGDVVISLYCPKGSNRLVVNVPSFQPIGSEERLSFGGGGEVVALVADSRGDPQRGGVSGTGPVPDNLPSLIAGQPSASYGAQVSGPHAAPPADLVRAFAAACSVAPPAEPAPPVADAAAGACRLQDGKVIPPNLLKAVGTEPFWAARVEGRCVTYSHPEDQAGTRIWTQFTGTRENGVWTGFYANQRFVLRTRPEAGCSDGMSDKRYPIAVSLSVAGEDRGGCAELL